MSSQYKAFNIPLTIAGKNILHQFTGKFRVLRIVDALGAIDLTGEIKVSIGNEDLDLITLGANNAVKVNVARQLNIEWDAQPGLVARVLISPNDGVFDVDADPPVQIVGGSIDIGDDGLTEITRKGYGQIGASKFDFNAVGLGTALLPATNTGGAIIRHGYLNALSGPIALYVDTAAPSSALDLTKHRLALCYSTTERFQMRDFYIPAGSGIYVYSSASAAAFLSFDLL